MAFKIENDYSKSREQFEILGQHSYWAIPMASGTESHDDNESIGERFQISLESASMSYHLNGLDFRRGDRFYTTPRFLSVNRTSLRAFFFKFALQRHRFEPSLFPQGLDDNQVDNYERNGCDTTSDEINIDDRQTFTSPDSGAPSRNPPPLTNHQRESPGRFLKEWLHRAQVGWIT